MFSDDVFGAPKRHLRDVAPNRIGGYSVKTHHIQPQTPMLYSIAAIQYFYDANTSYRTGNDICTFDPVTPLFLAIWDVAGTETISVDNFLTDCTINLSADSFSKSRNIL